jgi:kinetochore protein Spc25, fungi type
MATTFEPTLTLSLGRQPILAAGPSVADTLPSVNFGFDDLRDRMAKFTAKFDAFIEQGRKRVLEERNQFRMNVAELNGLSPPCLIFGNSHALMHYPHRGSANEEKRY